MQTIRWYIDDKRQKEIDKLQKSRKYLYEKLMKILSKSNYEDVKKLYKYKVMVKGSKNQRKRCSVRLSGQDRLVFEELYENGEITLVLVVLSVSGHYDDH